LNARREQPPFPGAGSALGRPVAKPITGPIRTRLYGAGGFVDLKLDHHTRDGIEVVDVEGEIDVYTAPRLRELLIELVNNGHYQLVVNM